MGVRMRGLLILTRARPKPSSRPKKAETTVSSSVTGSAARIRGNALIIKETSKSFTELSKNGSSLFSCAIRCYTLACVESLPMYSVHSRDRVPSSFISASTASIFCCKAAELLLYRMYTAGFWISSSLGMG